MKMKVSLLISLVLVFASCKSTHSIVESDVHKTSSKIDSVHIVKEITTKSVTVPKESAQLTLTEAKIRELPNEASYSISSGRAHANVTRLNDAIVFTADCDSVTMLLQNTRIMMLRYKKLADSLLSTTHTTEQVIVKEPTGWQWFQIYGFRLLLIFNLLLLIIKKTKIWQRIFY